MDFLTSLAIIFLSALLLSSICNKLKLPPLLGMLITGIILGPYFLDLISLSILDLSFELRTLALIIILTRAGLSINISSLYNKGMPTISLSFIPASLEIIGYCLLGIFVLKLSLFESLVLGTVMAAVSPAVLIPRMLKIKELNFGNAKKIPEILMTSASLESVFIITLFAALISANNDGSFSFAIIWQIPVAIILGILVGILTGLIVSNTFKLMKIPTNCKLLMLLSISFLFLALEQLIGERVPYASFLSIISMAVILLKKDNLSSKKLSVKYKNLWFFAEIMLFVLIGANLDFQNLEVSILKIILVIGIALAFRIVGIFISLFFSQLNKKERLFCALAFSPKATVQAALAAIPFSIGIASGSLILSVAVIAILITAPLGALFIDLSYPKLLDKDFITNNFN
ncbi:MAG: cation:proton antiporter [Erysipelotrichales bacterium]|nr:cation:proton antiporter [Erysipelotrichales bacterium]